MLIVKSTEYGGVPADTSSLRLGGVQFDDVHTLR
jgi:hypothetical protein